MDPKAQQNLELAKAHFQALRLNKAYAIFRRYYDRLPFRHEPEHAEYIGMFIRVLIELGKQFEIKFYLNEVERLYDECKVPALAYQLGMLYHFLPEPRLETARKVFESIMLNPDAKEFAPKAKMMLAHYYSMRGDVAACRDLIFSIPPLEDPTLQLLVNIWKGNVLRKEKKLPEARAMLRSVIDQVSVETNWYPYFSARVIEAHVLLEMGKWNDTEKIVNELRGIFIGNGFKTIQIELKSIESVLKEKKQAAFSPTLTGTHKDQKVLAI